MAERTAHKAEARPRATTAARSGMRYWVLQQGSDYFVVASENQPDLHVPEGERRKVIRGYQQTDAAAWNQAEELATFYHGSVRR